MAEKDLIEEIKKICNIKLKEKKLAEELKRTRKDNVMKAVRERNSGLDHRSSEGDELI